MLDAGEYSSSSSAAVSVSVSAECFTKRKKCKNKRRFSNDQIKSMETMFQNDTKLEPKMKLHLARELGLQPRQVAIWFQNKRARWKSKQLEKDYNLLHSNYNNLASQFESLNKVKQSLLLQLQKLNDLIDKTEKEGHHDHECCRHEEAFGGQGSTMGHAASTDHNNGGSGNKINIIKSSGTTEFEDDVKPPILSSLVRPEYGVGVLSDDECSRNHDYLGFDKETQLPNPADSSLTSPEEWGRLDPDGMLDQPSSSYQWWDFWS